MYTLAQVSFSMVLIEGKYAQTQKLRFQKTVIIKSKLVATKCFVTISRLKTVIEYARIWMYGTAITNKMCMKKLNFN